MSLMSRARKKYAADFPQRASFESAPVRTTTRQVGRTGTARDPKTGLPLQEPNQEHLHPYQARGLGDDPGVYHEMALSDGTIGGLDSFLTRAVVNAKWAVVHPEPTEMKPRAPTALEREVGEWMARYLGLDGTEGWLKGGFKSHLETADLRRRYGFSAFELTWSHVKWKGSTHIAPTGAHWRAPQSVHGWTWGRDRLTGMLQLVPKEHTSAALPLGLGTKETVTIPSYRLALYTNRGTPGNPEGVSDWRAAWAYWAAKKAVLLGYLLAADRIVGGTAIIEELALADGSPHPALSRADVEWLLPEVEAWFEGELAALVSPPGIKLSVEYPGAKLHDPSPVINLLNAEIRQAVSGQLFGLSARPGQGLAGSMSQALYDAIDAMAQGLAEQLNGVRSVEHVGIIRRAVRANFVIPDDFRWPVVKPTGIRWADVKACIDSGMKLQQFKGVLWTPETEVHWRRVQGLPPLSKKQFKARKDHEEEYLSSMLSGGADEQQRASEDGTQAPVEPPEQDAGDAA